MATTSREWQFSVPLDVQVGWGAASGNTLRGSSRRRFAVVWCTILFVLGTAPHLIGTFAPPAGHDGFGTIMFVNDFAQYEAAMAEGGRSSSWLVHDHFTPEPHEAAFMFPLYVGIGKLAALLGIPTLALYRVVEAAGRLTALVAIAWAALQLLPRGGRLSIVLATAGAGLGVWAALAQAAVGVPEPYGGNGSYELNNHTLLFAPAHVTFGMAITLAIIVLLVQAEVAWSPRRAGLLTLATLALCLLHPFNVVTLIVIAGALALLAVIWGRGVPSLMAMLLTGLAAVPFVLYNALTFGMDPFWGRAYGAQNVLPSPGLHEIPVDLGVFLFVGVPGLVVLWRLGGTARRLALAMGIMLMLMYAPVPFQRRFAFGVAPLLGIVTGVALAAWLPGVGPRARLQRVLLALLVVAAVGSPFMIYAGLAASTVFNAPIPVYRADPDLRAARDWLAANTTADDVVLASWDVANYLGGAIPGHTTGGHPVATLHAAQRRAASPTIFRSTADQAAAIREERPSILLSAGPAEPIFLPDAAVIFQSGDVRAVRLPRLGP